MNKKLLAKILSAVLAVIFAFGVLITPATQVHAAASRKIAYLDMIEAAGTNFLKAQYEAKEIAYTSLEKSDLVPMYDDGNAIVGYILILDRDGSKDYVVIDTVLNKMDEFGFDSDELTDAFKNPEKLLYAGTLNYAYRENGQLKNLGGEVIDEKEFSKAVNSFKTVGAMAATRVNGWDGIIDWANIADRVNNWHNGKQNASIRTSYMYYLPGIYRGGVASNLEFIDQNVYNYYYNQSHGTNADGTCGPTAMANMFIYFDRQLGKTNALVNDNAHSTFTSFMYHTDWFNWTNWNWWNNTISGFRAVASQQGYNANVKAYSNANWSCFKYLLQDQNMPVYACFAVNTDYEGYWNHAVVVLGAEEFELKYSTSTSYWFFGWRERVTWHTEYLQYLRVIDGWYSSNSARFVDFNGYYTKSQAIGVGLN